eukprot:scaffold264395_cov93-Cyclotella_meneghiniana.AAC.1
MSKQIANDWKKVDDLTHSIFKELAVADDKRYKKELFDSYQSYARNQWNTQTLPSQEMFENGMIAQSGTRRTLKVNHSIPMIHAPSPQDAQLPALKSNRDDPMLKIPENQAQVKQVQDPKVQSHGAISHPGRYNSRMGTGIEEITE